MQKLGGIIDNLKQGKDAPTRHHNPYLTQALLLNDFLYTEDELSKNKGTVFQNSNTKFVLEIGCYMGKNVLEFSQQNPDTNFIGLDITYKRAVKAAKKLKRNNITNAKIALCDGRRFLEEFIPKNFTPPNSNSNEASLHGVCVFFPDPWPKDRHEKNRLLKKEFINLLKEKLVKNGFFWFKTDAHSYFQQTESLLLESGFVIETESLDCHLNKPKALSGGPYETSFQKIFTAKEVPFYQNVYIKK